ncbi:MAG: hypothetical protein WB420_07530, partial [Bradyrhizobium sp.]
MFRQCFSRAGFPGYNDDRREGDEDYERDSGIPSQHISSIFANTCQPADVWGSTHEESAEEVNEDEHDHQRSQPAEPELG